WLLKKHHFQEIWIGRNDAVPCYEEIVILIDSKNATAPRICLWKGYEIVRRSLVWALEIAIGSGVSQSVIGNGSEA
ncbi:hypothetical protein BGZ65_000824, partial [Modicella reniformis]